MSATRCDLQAFPSRYLLAVLKRDDTGVGADESARLLTCRLGIPELYGE
jgi:hypothetical protein